MSRICQNARTCKEVLCGHHHIHTENSFSCIGTCSNEEGVLGSTCVTVLII